jgi:hypothetical protein
MASIFQVGYVFLTLQKLLSSRLTSTDYNNLDLSEFY